MVIQPVAAEIVDALESAAAVEGIVPIQAVQEFTQNQSEF